MPLSYIGQGLDALSNIPAFKLEKLTIKAFSKSQRSRRRAAHMGLTNAQIKTEYGEDLTSAPIPVIIMEVPFNPESLTISYAMNWQTLQALGAPGARLNYNGNDPDLIKCTLIFAESDVLLRGIGLNKGAGYSHYEQSIKYDKWGDKFFSKAEGVKKDVERFLTICTGALSAEHRPLFLQLSWGNTLIRPRAVNTGDDISKEVNYNYPCQLQSVDVKYTLFSRQGDPLRAELDCVFKEDATSDEDGELQSPDVTHAKTMGVGQRLSDPAGEIYERPDWYTKIARVNQLDSVRNVPSGTMINVPPLQG